MNIQMSIAAKLLNLHNVEFSFFVRGREFSKQTIERSYPDWRVTGRDNDGVDCTVYLTATSIIWVNLKQFEC